MECAVDHTSKLSFGWSAPSKS